jgi:cytochrome b561
MGSTPFANTPQRYGWIAIALHWAMAALLVGLLGLGIFMVGLPEIGYDREKITLILVHKALGMIALAAAVARLSWRLTNALPRFVAGLPPWQEVSALFVHLWLYALMFAVPLTGWLMSSAGGYPTPIFAWLDAPDLIGRNEHLFRTLIDVHRWLAYAFAGLVVLHTAAALRHHLVRKDHTLRRMLPGG